MTPLLTIAGTPVFYPLSDASMIFLKGSEIDDDGKGGNSAKDPCFQSDTSYQPTLDAEADRFIVLPDAVFLAVTPLVLGCKCRLTNIKTGLCFFGVVGDRGPAGKLGEMSVAYAQALGVPSSPTQGGIDDPVIVWEIWPGVAANVNGKQYTLQSYLS